MTDFADKAGPEHGAASFHASPGVARALEEGRAVVALESTVIAHGLPAPHNLITALGCETEVRASGAEPATIAILGGRPVIGLEHEQIEAVASRRDMAKVNTANLGAVVAGKSWGATTVAATMHLAHAAGIRVFSTGGIGGVHRGASDTFDVSSDLTALSRYPLVVVCAGAKAILDLPKTFEALEMLGVPVVGYGADELPAFYSRRSRVRLDLRADSPEEVAALAKAHWHLGLRSAVLVVQPLREEIEVPIEEVEGAIARALAEADAAGIRGKAVTPYLLGRVAELTDGRALEANIALLRQNARLAGEIAMRMGAD